MDFNIPILLIAWRRPEHLKKVIAVLRIIKPKSVYVAIDGIRNGDEFYLERQNIKSTKDIIFSEINWECELHTLIRENNMGCALGVSSAITWFFDNVEYGIIL